VHDSDYCEDQCFLVARDNQKMVLVDFRPPVRRIHRVKFTLVSSWSPFKSISSNFFDKYELSTNYAKTSSINLNFQTAKIRETVIRDSSIRK